MKFPKLVLAVVLIGLISLLVIDQKENPDITKSMPGLSAKSNPYDSPEAYIAYKKQMRKNGRAKSEAPEAYALFERAKRTPNDKSAPEYRPNQKLTELNKARSSKEFRLKSRDLQFIERGPGNVAGRTRALLILPDPDLQTWLAGSATGGIWKTKNGGQSWIDKTPDLPNLGTNTLAMSTSNPDIIYAGTGEHFTADIDGVGMFKSEDQGETWTQIVAAGDYDAFRNVSRIVVHPDNPDIVIATTRNSVFADSLRAAIYKSIDGGSTWELKSFSTIDRYDDIAVNKENFNTIYVAVRRKGVLKSKDQGETWVNMSRGLQVNGRIEIATSPVDTNYVWGSAQGIGSGSGSDLYLSRDGGELWKLAVEGDGTPINFLGGQGWFDNVIEPHPYDANVAYVGGVNLFKMKVSPGEIKDAVYDIQDEGAFSFLDFINGITIGGGILEGNLDAEEVKSIQLRFGQGGQMAHRFSVNGRGAGVPAADYEYRDLVAIPFQAWDIDNDRQLMVSFRDQAEDSTWTLKERTLNTANTSEDTREYIFIHDVDYADTVHADIAIDGGHEFRQLYFMWPVLRDGASFDPTETMDPTSFRIDAEVVTRESIQTTVISDAYNDFNGNNGFSSAEFSNNRGHHPDQHSVHIVIVDSSNKWFQLITTNDGGVYRSNGGKDPGIADNSFTYAGFRYNTTQFYSADKMPGEDRYIGGMQDNSTWYTTKGESATSNSAYEFAFGGDGFEVIWNNRDPDLIIGSVQFNSFRRSVNQGRNWSNATSGITDQGPFISRLANSRARPERLYTVGSSGIWVSDNFGEKWTSVPIQDQWSFNNGIDIEVSPANPDVVWAGGALDEIERYFVSTDAGKSFHPSGFYATIEMGTSSGLGLHPTQDSTAYALFSFAERPKVLRTLDLGVTWEDVSGFENGNGESLRGFPDVAINCLLVFPNELNRIWVGSEIGIIESLDNGMTWNLLNANLPSVNVFDLKIQDDQIIVATYGRGIWSVQVDGIAQSYVFAPAISSAALAPDGLISMEIEHRSLYDSLTIFMDGIGFRPLTITNPEILSQSTFQTIFDILSAVEEDGTYTFYLIAYKDGLAYRSLDFQVNLFKPGKPTKEYFNDFSVDSLLGDFIGSGFSVRMEPGFSDLAIHSDHNYHDLGEITYQLRTPIIVSEAQTFKYRDVVIVEPGEANVRFGSEDFFDYVVTEGSKDGVNWKVLADGYDSTSDPNWLGTYNSEGRGNSDLFLEQEIDLTNTFDIDDIIFIRFRLFADPFVNGWGWAIDDVTVALENTTPVFDPAFESFLVYPNPARDMIHIHLPASLENRTIFISDIQGRRVKNISPGGDHNDVSIQTNDLPGGLYVIEVFENNRLVVTEKLVIVD